LIKKNNRKGKRFWSELEQNFIIYIPISISFSHFISKTSIILRLIKIIKLLKKNFFYLFIFETKCNTIFNNYNCKNYFFLIWALNYIFNIYLHFNILFNTKELKSLIYMYIYSIYKKTCMFMHYYYYYVQC
jgi:hypothetical protein